MACGTGCTDCPACRGEVPHDSPAMHDLAWGVMTSLDSGATGYWASHAAMEIARRTIQGRGATLPGDREILAVIDQALQSVSARAAPGLPGWVHADETSPPPVARGGPPGDAEPTKEPVSGPAAPTGAPMPPELMRRLLDAILRDRLAVRWPNRILGKGTWMRPEYNTVQTKPVRRVLVPDIVQDVITFGLPTRPGNLVEPPPVLRTRI
jgi:hypothetical protein